MHAWVLIKVNQYWHYDFLKQILYCHYNCVIRVSFNAEKLEGTARYAGFASSSCRGLRPPAEAFFCPSGKKKSFLCSFGLL